MGLRTGLDVFEKVKFLLRLQRSVHPAASSLYRLRCHGHATDPAFAKNCFLFISNPLSADCYSAEFIIFQGCKIFGLATSEEVCFQQLPIPPSRDLKQCTMRYFRHAKDKRSTKSQVYTEDVGT
jgi:hypothetical protein